MPFFKILIHDPISTNKLPYKAEDYFSLCSTWKYEGKKKISCRICIKDLLTWMVRVWDALYSLKIFSPGVLSKG